jgi:hypothetical protein
MEDRMGYLTSGVEGYVTDYNTGQRIGYACIFTNTNTTVHSDSNGYYFFPHDGGMTIAINSTAPYYYNWKKGSLTLYDGVIKFLNIKMRPSP